MTSHIIFAYADNLLHSRQLNSKSPSLRGGTREGRDKETALHKQSYHTRVSCESSRGNRTEPFGFFASQTGGVR